MDGFSDRGSIPLASTNFTHVFVPWDESVNFLRENRARIICTSQGSLSSVSPLETAGNVMELYADVVIIDNHSLDIEIDELSALRQCAIEKHLLCSAVCSDNLGRIYALTAT